MIEYERIDISERVDVDKTNKSKECMLCHYWYFLHKNFSHGSYLCDDYYNFSQNLEILKILLLLILKKYIQNLFFKYE